MLTGKSAIKRPAVQHAGFIERAPVDGNPSLAKEVYEFKGMRYSFFANPYFGGWLTITILRKAGHRGNTWWESCGSDRAETVEQAHQVAQDRILEYFTGRARS